VKSLPETLSHEFRVHGLHSVLEAAGGVPVHESLDAAADYLEAVVGGLHGLMQESSISHQATLILFAVENALALVYAAHAGVDPDQGGSV